DLTAAQRVDLDALRLEEHLVARLVREPGDLVLDAGAVARPGALDRALVERRAVEVGADDVVGRRRGVRDPARPLRQRRPPPGRAEHLEARRRIVAGLDLEAGDVDGARVEAARRPGLEPRDREAELLERAGQGHRG